MGKLVLMMLCAGMLWGCSGMMAMRPSASGNISENTSLQKVIPVMPLGTKDLSLSRLTFVYGDRPALVKACKAAWGLAVLLEIDGRRIPFNAGGEEGLMRNNMEALQIDPKTLDAVVISHHHWEMVDGIGYLLRENPNLPVYATAMITNELGINAWAKNFKHVYGKLQLTPNVLLLKLKSPRFEGGPFGLNEIHMVIKTKEGLIILQGCGHPRIVNIMEKSIAATGEKRVYMIAGGTRLLPPGTSVKLPDGSSFVIPQMTDYTVEDYRRIADELLLAGVKKIIPTHCTGEPAEAVFKEKFGDNYINQTLGMKIDIPAAADL